MTTKHNEEVKDKRYYRIFYEEKLAKLLAEKSHSLWFNDFDKIILEALSTLRLEERKAVGREILEMIEKEKYENWQSKWRLVDEIEEFVESLTGLHEK